MKKLILILISIVGCLSFLVGCGTKIEIKNCDDSVINIDQGSEQSTDNALPSL